MTCTIRAGWRVAPWMQPSKGVGWRVLAGRAAQLGSRGKSKTLIVGFGEQQPDLGWPPQAARFSLLLWRVILSVLEAPRSMLFANERGLPPLVQNPLVARRCGSYGGGDNRCKDSEYT